MVGLGIDGAAAPCEALDDVQFPQWAVPVEQRLVQAGDAIMQFALAPRFGQLMAADMVLEVHVASGHPHRVDQVPGQAGGPAGEHFARAQPGTDQAAKVLEESLPGAGGRGEHEQRPDVHRGGRRLDVQECGIDELDRFHGSRASALRCCVYCVRSCFLSTLPCGLSGSCSTNSQRFGTL